MNASCRCLVSLVLSLLALGLLGCPSRHTATVPRWTESSVPYGQGRVHLGLRFRWVAVRDPRGALITTPDGGSAKVRVFFCGKSVREIKSLIHRQLRSRLVLAELVEQGRVLVWRWLRKPMAGEEVGTAVTRHGPLLIAVESATIPLEDLAKVALRVRLDLPVPAIYGCFPLCIGEAKCIPQTGEGEGGDLPGDDVPL